MTDTLRVARVRARYRLPASGADARARLDRLLREVADEALDHALTRGGVPAHEEICIRSVHAPVELRLGAPDSALVAAWSVALAESIGRAIAVGGPGVVRYRTRAHALTDLVLGAAAGDHRRAWAWRQLGLWRVGDDPARGAAADETVRALLAAPESIAPVTAAAARAGALPRLLELLPAPAWTAVAAAALDAYELPVAPLLHRAAAGVEAADGEEHRAARVVAASAIAAATRDLPDVDPEPRRVLALLAILEIDPTELDRGTARARRLVSLVERETAGAGGAPGTGGVRAEAEARATAGRGAGRDRAMDVPLARPSSAPAADGSARAGRVAPGAEETEEAAPDDRPLPELPRTAATEWGGLLFLLHVVDELQLPAAVLRDDTFRARTLRWVLHRLAMRLTGAEARDPASLAFAATPPDEPAPSDGEESPSEEERGAIESLAARVTTRLHERVRGEPGPSGAAAHAFARSVVRRGARISCTPGWFDVLLRLDEVSVEVRRAGLDLDPGWVPWLGAVVRFVYE
jgi:hypothetical protein